MSVTSEWEWTDVSTDRNNRYNPDGSLYDSKFDWMLTRTRISDAPFVTAAGSMINSGGITAYNAGIAVTYTPPLYYYFDGVSTAYYMRLYCQDDTISYRIGGIPWYKQTQLWSYKTGWIPASFL